MKIKRILTTILMAALFLCIMPFDAYAVWGEGNTLEDALSQLDVNFAANQLDWLQLPGGIGVVKQRYTYFLYKNERTGQLEEHPVYCVDPTKGGAHEIVASIGPDANGDNVATYIRGDNVGDVRYMAILYCGYPHMQLASLGLQTVEEGYYATKVALWMYIRGNSPTQLTINPAYGNSDPVALRVHQAAVNIYNNSATFPVREPQLTMTGKPSATANLDTNGQYYVQGIEVYASGWIGDNPAASGDVQLSWSSPPPAGTIVLGTDGEDISSSLAVRMNAVEGVGRFGTVTIKYPASAVEEDFSPPTLNAKALLPNADVYVAYAQAGKDKYQRYLVEADTKIPIVASFVSQVPVIPWDDDRPDTGLRIRKVEAGTNTPLAGAVFEIRDPEGKLIYSLATPASGIIDIPLAVMGNYTVTETTPPQYHLLPEVRTQSVTVRYGEVAEVTFVNAPYGTLRVSKYDAANGRPLSGAAIQIRNIVTNTTQEGRTDSSGKVVFTKLPVGAYEIVELASPEGYALDESVHTVNVVSLSEGETSYTLTNKALPGLRIIKFDRQTMTPIGGVTFEIWRDGELYGTYVTDAWGEIELRNIPAGTYTAREVATVAPYVLDTTAQWIEIKAGQGYISELIFFNLLKPGISLVKIDSETFAPLVNAKFLIRQVGGSFAKEYTTDANGEINLAELEPGAYTVEEITAPSGYLIDDAIRTIQINAGENAQFVFTNTLKPVLEILKFDGEKYLPGATFRIAKIADGSHYLDRISDENGRIRIEGLEPGIYSVKEMQPPPGYVPNETEYHVELFPGKTSQLVVVNIKKPSLIVWKYDEQAAKPLPDTEFSIAKKGGSIIYEGITNSDGFIRLADLDVGWYTVSELAPPPGYLPGNPSTKDVYLEPGKTVEIKFDNIRRPTLIFLKTNAVTGAGIAGATFKVEYEAPGGGLKTIGSFKTGSDGRIIIPKVEPGWYVLTETLPAPGFSLPKNPVTRMYVEDGQNAYLAEFAHYYNGGAEQGADNTLYADSLSTTVQIEEHSGGEYYLEGEGFNWPLNSIVIKKTHAITGELLAGAAFELYRADEQVSGIPGTNIGRYTTDNSGVVVITGLEPGYYFVKEVQAPQNFLLSENSQQNGFLKADGTTVLEFTFANYPYGGLLITKVDAQTNKPLAGARFRVADSGGAVVGNANGEYATDSQGEIHIPNIKPGSYVVTEIAAPAGYAIDATPQTVKVGTDGGIYRLSFRNQPDGGLQIVKLNSATRQPIEGVEFLVSHMNGERVGNYRVSVKYPRTSNKSNGSATITMKNLKNYKW